MLLLDNIDWQITSMCARALEHGLDANFSEEIIAISLHKNRETLINPLIDVNGGVTITATHMTNK